MTRDDLHLLAEVRLKEAKLLLENNCSAGAYYLAGYAAECALKACIAKHTKLHDFPDLDRVTKSYMHDPSKLAVTADLDSAFKLEESRSRDFRRNWAIVRLWNEKARYREWSVVEAQALVSALEDPVDGVLTWLKHRW